MNIETAVSTLYTVVGSGRYKRTKEHNSLVLDTLGNRYYWNSLDEGGSVADFLVRHLGLSRSVADVLGDAPTPQAPKTTVALNPLLVEMAAQSTKRDFWYSRGITDAEIEIYRLGYLADWYVIPFYMQQQLTAVMLRKEHKFISQLPGSRPSLFGLDVLTEKEILLVESPLDVPLLRRFGFQAISHNYGAQTWEKSWNGLLYPYTITVIPDNDTAGRLGLRHLDLFCNVAVWPKGTPVGFDCGKLYKSNPDKFVNNINYLITTAVPLSWIKARN